MTEEAIFAGALEKSTSAERDAYLDSACSGDVALRRRVEALLKSHEEAAGFLGTPAVQIAAEALACQGRSADTQPEPPGGSDTIRLDFLSPSEDPQALGRIKEYTVTEVIGRGGMGIVLKARDASLDRVVAIKVLAPELAGKATARKRFLREAKTAAAVTHQHVVTIHAVGEDRLPYLVMECVSGQSLQEKLDQQGPLELREVLRIGTQVASGLAAAHAHGVIHRDIKPANILLENGIERVRITDFGLARAVDDVAMTRTGEVAGTPQYMSPEQAQGQPVDARSDLFSFGSVLYAMCTGRPPFRAETTIDAIRRVCDDMPRPIREINAEVPEWLTEIIDRLLAKRPEERFQTAQEVAQLLGKHLAHVQDPGSTPFPMLTPPSPLGGEGTGVRGKASRRWVAAAVVLCAVLAGLGVTEGTGVTQLAKTVVNIVTNEGTLVIEVDDPTVQVSLDGEVLTISGGGVEQVKLRPGQYQFTATKNGRPVKQELVTITRGSEKVVTVSREPIESTSTVPIAAPAGGIQERNPFVLLTGEDIVEREFDTLAGAVLAAGDGDTIEVRGNGPFVTSPIKLGQTALTIRAGPGFRPVISLSFADRHARALVETDAALVLEGLELQRMDQDPAESGIGIYRSVLDYSPSPLYAANCRFLTNQFHACICSNSPTCELRNCEILCPNADRTSAVVWAFGQSGGRLLISNCVHAGGEIAVGHHAGDAREPGSIQLAHNTSLTTYGILRFNFDHDHFERLPKEDREKQLFRLQASGNVFDGIGPIVSWLSDRVHHRGEAEAFLKMRTSWQGQQNLFSVSGSFLGPSRWAGVPDHTGKPSPSAVEPAEPIETLAQWQEFWGSTETGSIEGSPRYRGGIIRSRLHDSPAKLTPEDFRLRADSAGYRAGPDGKDLGADIDLVGPGPAYERWKTTPEYQDWLEETGQAEKPE